MCLRPRRSIGRGRKPACRPTRLCRAPRCGELHGLRAAAGELKSNWPTKIPRVSGRNAQIITSPTVFLLHAPSASLSSLRRRPKDPFPLPRSSPPSHGKKLVLLSSICSHLRRTNTTGLRPGRARCADVGAASAATRRAVAAVVGVMAALVPNAAAVAAVARRSAAMRCRALWCARGRRAASAAGRASARRPLGAAGALSAAVSDGAARAAADADVHTFTVGESAKQKVRDRDCLFRHRACRLVRAIHQPRARNPRERVFAREREPRAQRSAADAVAAFKLALLTAMRLYIPAVARPPGLYASFARRGPPVRSRRSCASTPFCPRRCPM